MLDTWAERFPMGVAHEAIVESMLLERCWFVKRFDAPLDGREIRAAFEVDDQVNPLRWAPDFIATRKTLGAWERFFIDAKSTSDENKGRPNVSVTTAALDAHRVWAAAFRTPIVYVFADFWTATPDDFAADGSDGRIVPGRGSGDPYMLLHKEHCRTFDDRFSQVVVRP